MNGHVTTFTTTLTDGACVETIYGAKNKFDPPTTVIAAFATVLLIWKAASTGLQGDELLFLHAVDLGFFGGLFAPGSSHPPLMRCFVSAIADLHSPEWLIRLPSVTFSIGTVFVWSRILQRLFDDRRIRTLLLAGMALNIVWLDLAFQCLPYAPFSCFAALHCLAWLRYLEAPHSSNRSLLIVSGIVLPWTHFCGVHVLLADQFIWILLLIRRRFEWTEFLRINLLIATFTLPVVPLALFYARTEAPYSIKTITDFWPYFIAASGEIFSLQTTAAFIPWQAGLILQCLLLIGTAAYLLNRFPYKCSTQTSVKSMESTIVIAGFLISALAAGQVQSLVTAKAMWPRYMLSGAWVQIPLAVFLLQQAGLRISAFGVTMVTLLLTSACHINGVSSTAIHYQQVTERIDSAWQPGDAFLAQSMDMWEGDNHFDQIWFRRYLNAAGPIVSGPNMLRPELYDSGLPLNTLSAETSRVWVFSHLFRESWLRHQQIEGWELTDIDTNSGPYPLALFQRSTPLRDVN